MDIERKVGATSQFEAHYKEQNAGIKDTVASGVGSVKDIARDVYTGFTWDKRSMRDLTNWTILVVGATDGVGFDSPKAFAEHNAQVVMVGRSEDKGEM